MANLKPLQTPLQVPADLPQQNLLSGGNLSGPEFNVEYPMPAPVRAEQQQQRQDATSVGDYASAMYHQDSFLNGLLANYAGNEITPQEGYNPFTDPQIAEMQKGLWPEFRDQLYQATSPAHAQYLHSLIVDKQHEQTILGDLGWKGNTARFIAGAAAPENLLAGLAGGWAARGVTAVRMAGAAKAATQAAPGLERVKAAEAVAAATADMAKAGSSAPAVAAGIVSGGVVNAALEKLRQGTNFENDGGLVAEAFLFGSALAGVAAPFGVRSQRRIFTAAAAERDALAALRKAATGEALTEAEQAVVKEVVDAHAAIKQLDSGHVDGTDAEGLAGAMARVQERVDALHGGASKMTDAEFLAAEQQRVRAALESMMNDVFPDRGQPVPKGPSQEDLAKLEARAARSDALWAARNDVPLLRTSGLPPEDPQALQKALDRVNGELPLKGKLQAELDKARADLSAARAREAEARAQGATADAKAAAFAQAEADAAAQKARDFEMMLNEREIRDAGFGPNSIGAGQTGNLMQDPGGEIAFHKARFDLFAKLYSSKNSVVREMAFRLIKDPIQVSDEFAQGWTASELKAQYRRTIGGRFHREFADSLVEATKALGLPFWKRWELVNGGWTRDFSEMVTKVARGDAQVLADNPQIATHLQRGAGALKRLYADMLSEAKANGVRGAEMITPDPNGNYVNRVWNHNRIRDAILKHGEPAVVQAVANAIRVPGFAGDTAKAASFLQAVRRLEYSSVFKDIQMHGRDLHTLRGLLAKEGLPDQQINDLIDVMFETHNAGKEADAGVAPRLKFRFDLDENLPTHTPYGVLKVSDLLENDARLLADNYINSMGGHSALAKKGFSDRAEFEAWVRKADEEHGGSQSAMTDATAFNGEKKWLYDLYDHITGAPMSMQDHSMPARIANGLRGYTRAALLGQLGIVAMFEMGQAVSLAGVRAAYLQMPTFRQFIHAARRGYVPSRQLARDIEQMVGFGNEMAAGYLRQHELADGFYDSSLTRWENFGNKASHVTDVLSGNASFTSFTRQLAGMMTVQKHVDFAHGTRKLTDKARARLVGHGLDAENIDAVLGDLKRYSDVGPNGRVEKLRYDEWQRANPVTYEQYQLALSRDVRDAIQDHDIGETMPWMHNTLGKVVSELRTFMLVSHAKNFLKNAHYRDAVTLQLYSISAVANALAYVSQTALNYGNNPAELDKRLSLDWIAKAVFMRTAAFGMVPSLYATMYDTATGGHSFTQPGLTANTDNRNLLRTPSYLVAGKLLSVPPAVVGPMFGATTTSKEARDALTGLPGASLTGIRTLINAFADEFPKSDPNAPHQPR